MITESNMHIDILGLRLNQSDEEALKTTFENVKKQIQKYDDDRKNVVTDIFSKSEAARTNARRKLQKEHNLDKKLIPDLLAVGKEKISSENADSYFQVIYLLGQLDNSNLEANQSALNEIFKLGQDAGLNGPRTTRDINNIEKRIGKK